MKESEAVRLVGKLRDRFPRQRKDFDMKTAAAYCEDILDLEYGVALAAVRTLAATCDWFPSIAEIRAAYADIAHPTPDADKAWAAALKYGNRCGWGRMKDPPESNLHAAVLSAIEGLGGWKHLGKCADMSMERAHFLKLYATTRQRHRDNIVVGKLLARHQKLLEGDNETTPKDKNVEDR